MRDENVWEKKERKIPSICSKLKNIRSDATNSNPVKHVK